MSNFLKFIKNTVKHWYLLLIVGLLFVGAAFFSFARPLETYLTLAIFFGVAFLLAGISEIVFSISNRKEMDNWGWTLVLGISTLIFGLILMAHPGITMITLPFILGFILLFRSIGTISNAIDLKHYKDSSWGWILVSGILGTLFSLLILWAPVIGGLSITIWIGLTFLILGISSIAVSFKLRQLHKIPGKVSKELKDKLEAVEKEIEGVML